MADSKRKAFRVMFMTSDEPHEMSIATSIQVIIPEGATKAEAWDFALKHIANEMGRYALGECIERLYSD